MNILGPFNDTQLGTSRALSLVLQEKARILQDFPHHPVFFGLKDNQQVVYLLDGEKCVAANVWYLRKDISWMAEDLLAVVHPDYQGIGLFTKMSDFRKELILKHNIKVIGHSLHVDNERMLLIYKKKGFVPFNVVYHKRIG